MKRTKTIGAAVQRPPGESKSTPRRREPYSIEQVYDRWFAGIRPCAEIRMARAVREPACEVFLSAAAFDLDPPPLGTDVTIASAELGVSRIYRCCANHLWRDPTDGTEIVSGVTLMPVELLAARAAARTSP